jgi:toxin ParE1/3/4
VTGKPVVPRHRASRDVDDAVEFYVTEGGAQSALGFIDALAEAYDRIGRNPAIGSPRYAHELDLPGLRTWSLRQYPYLVFYVERGDHVDVWRVLHSHRDVPALLRDETSPS